MRHLSKLSLPTVAVSLLLAACGGSGGGHAAGSTSGKSGGSSGNAATHASTGSGAVVKTASSSLGKILVDSEGMTLYHLSGERNGKFICTTSACLGTWHPLTVPAGSTPKGTVSSLGTVKRPEGTTQVTYRGMPLYTFAQDRQPGETNGEGFKDVGTWSAVTTSGGSGAASSESSTTSSGEESASSYGKEGGYKY